MDNAFVKSQEKMQAGVIRNKKNKRWLILFSSFFFIVEYLTFLHSKQSLLLVFNSLLILLISFYGRDVTKLNSKALFVLLSLFIILVINYFLIESVHYRNLFVGVCILITGVYALTIKIEKNNLVFYYWIMFCKFLQFQIAFTVIIYSLECLYGIYFSYGSLFFGGSILLLYLLFTAFTFLILKKQEISFCENLNVKGKDYKLNDLELTILNKMESFFENSNQYLDIQFSFDDLSKELEVSKADLSKLIHKVHQVSFYKFIAYKRVYVALERLKELDKKTTIESVMVECGFSSKPTFNKYFKEITGVTPSEFIKR